MFVETRYIFFVAVEDPRAHVLAAANVELSILDDCVFCLAVSVRATDDGSCWRLVFALSQQGLARLGPAPSLLV